ncbi:MAG: DUF3108 domain-containing protein [Deltaproteobacteria bacterium]|nr:DUF3108 domain-containing protein [Deltaproteobacteria bacterium]
MMRKLKLLFPVTIPLILILLIPVFTLSLRSTAEAEEEHGAPTIADSFSGEVLDYVIGFWFFDNVAEAKLSLEKGEKGEYIARLEAYTTGVIKGIADRHDVYIARLMVVDKGKRFLTQTFEKSVTMRGKTRRNLTVVDYKKRVVRWRSWGGGKEEKTGQANIPPGIYCDDPLAAFYNLRAGVYGPMQEGKEFRLFAFPKGDNVPEIKVRIAEKAELQEKARKNKSSSDFYAPQRLAIATMGPELFASEGVDLFFNSSFVPVEAVARDVMLFGDVRGRLTGGTPFKAGLQN